LENKKTIVKNLGVIDYEEALEYQKELFSHNVDLKLKNRKEGTNLQTQNYLLLCEHPPVYTLGRSGDKNNLLLNSELLKQSGAKYYEIGRGGDITFHGPGQLVIYPVLDLENFFTDIHKYLRLLEEAVILTLKDYGVEAGRIDGLTGVWIDHVKQVFPRKICAMGVKASRWVTMHGLALNITTELKYFNNIIPCGISDKAVTSLSLELKNKPITVSEVGEKMVKHISNLFEMEII